MIEGAEPDERGQAGLQKGTGGRLIRASEWTREDIYSPESIHNMDEHTGAGEHHGDFSAPPSSITALVTRVIISALKSSGRDDWAENIVNAPEKLGEKLGPALRVVIGKVREGQLVTPEEVRAVNDGVDANPTAALMVIGEAIVSVARDTLDAAEEARRLLSAYNVIFEIVCEAMRSAQTSFALRGFLHDGECISYWHLDGNNPRFESVSNSLRPYDVRVFVLSAAPSDESLAMLNENIRRDEKRHLPREYYNYAENETIGMIAEVHELSVTINRLHPDRDELMQREVNLFDRDSRYARPIEFVYEIPFGAPSLLALCESMLDASRVQNGAWQRTRQTLDAVVSRSPLQSESL